MDVQAPMAKRLKVIFRILATVTLLEGLVGLYGVALDVSIVPLTLEYMQQTGRPHVYSAWVLFVMAGINLVFDAMLFVAGTFLWKLQRKGLFLLVCTLLAEMVCFLGTLTLSNYLDRGHSVDYTLFLGSGNAAIVFQLLTAFPIVAGILIFFAYRYLGIPPRPLN